MTSEMKKALEVVAKYGLAQPGTGLRPVDVHEREAAMETVRRAVSGGLVPTGESPDAPSLTTSTAELFAAASKGVTMGLGVEDPVRKEAEAALSALAQRMGAMARAVAVLVQQERTGVYPRREDTIAAWNTLENAITEASPIVAPDEMALSEQRQRADSEASRAEQERTASEEGRREGLEQAAELFDVRAAMWTNGNAKWQKSQAETDAKNIRALAGQLAQEAPRQDEPPDTAALFATVRADLDSRDPAVPGSVALAALEGRVRAMAQTLRALLAWAAAGRQEGLTRLLAQAQSALTDAPPVFTLEEVEEAMDDEMYHGDDAELSQVEKTRNAALLDLLRRLRERKEKANARG